MASHSGATDVEPVALIERAMVQIRMSQSRNTLLRLLAQRFGDRAEAAVPVVEAIEAGDAGDGVVTVGLVAQRLGHDRSHTSRLIAACVEAGYVSRLTSERDGREVHLDLTPKGQTLAAVAHELRQTMYTKFMENWNNEEQRLFASLVARFSDAFAETTSRVKNAADPGAALRAAPELAEVIQRDHSAS